MHNKVLLLSAFYISSSSAEQSRSPLPPISGGTDHSSRLDNHHNRRDSLKGGRSGIPVYKGRRSHRPRSRSQPHRRRSASVPQRRASSQRRRRRGTSYNGRRSPGRRASPPSRRSSSRRASSRRGQRRRVGSSPYRARSRSYSPHRRRDDTRLPPIRSRR